MNRRHEIVCVVGLLYLTYMLLFLAKFGFNPSATIEFSEKYVGWYNGTLPHGLVIQSNSEGYDGQFYYMVAADPAASHIILDPQVYQRILYPLLARILSFGNIQWIPVTMLLINYASILLSTYVILLLLERYGASFNLAYVWAFNVGFMTTILRDLTSPLMILFVVSALYMLELRRFWLSSVFFSLALLTKESAIVVLASALLFFIVKKEWGAVVVNTLSFVPYVVWQYVVLLKTQTSPYLISSSTLYPPLLGVLVYLILLPMCSGLIPLVYHMSSLLVLAFAAVQTHYFIRDKPKVISLYLVLLLSQILLVLSFNPEPYYASIDCLGRNSLGLFLSSILYYAESKRKYPVPLILIMALMSLYYFIEKIVVFSVEYSIS